MAAISKGQTCGQTGTMIGVWKAKHRRRASGKRSSKRFIWRSSCIIRSSLAPALRLMITHDYNYPLSLLIGAKGLVIVRYLQGQVQEPVHDALICTCFLRIHQEFTHAIFVSKHFAAGKVRAHCLHYCSAFLTEQHSSPLLVLLRIDVRSCPPILQVCDAGTKLTSPGI